MSTAREALEAAQKALKRIAKWYDEFPTTGKTWPDGSVMSYSAAYGSNGERDYMRQIAASVVPLVTAALAAPDAGPADAQLTEWKALAQWLRVQAKGASNVQKMLAKDKSNRNRVAAGKPIDGTSDYLAPEPEQTREWRSAQAIDDLISRVAAPPPPDAPKVAAPNPNEDGNGPYKYQTKPLPISSRPSEEPEAMPVAWRVKDFADGWILCHSKNDAEVMSRAHSGAAMEPLFSRPQPSEKPVEGWGNVTQEMFYAAGAACNWSLTHEFLWRALRAAAAVRPKDERAKTETQDGSQG